MANAPRTASRILAIKQYQAAQGTPPPPVQFTRVDDDGNIRVTDEGAERVVRNT